MAVKVKLLGVEGLRARLNAMSDQAATAALEQAVKAGIDACFAAEQKKTPVLTGHMRGLLEVRTISKERSRVRIGIFIGKDAFYWRFLEFGTKFMPATAHQWIRRVFKPRRGYFRGIVRDTFRDRLRGFID